MAGCFGALKHQRKTAFSVSSRDRASVCNKRFQPATTQEISAVKEISVHHNAVEVTRHVAFSVKCVM